MGATPGAAWFAGAAAFYGLAVLAYLAALSGRDWLTRLGHAFLGVALVMHVAEIGSRGVAGIHPVTSTRETVSFAAFLIALAALAAQIKFGLRAVGAFLVPAALLLFLGARIAPVGRREDLEALGVLGRVHISLAAVGVAFFTIAAALAAVYLVQDRQLRSKVHALKRPGDALETLDRLVHLAVRIGFPIFTIAMLTGAIWSARLSTTIRPEYVISGVAWGAFAGLLVARMTAGWRGRKAAFLTIVGFTASLVVLGAYLLRAAQGA